MTEPLFQPLDAYGARRSVRTSEFATRGNALTVEAWDNRVTVAVSRNSMAANFDLRPDVARALAAELIAAAGAAEAGDQPQA